MLKGKRRDEAEDALRELSAAFLRRRASPKTGPSYADGDAGLAVVHSALDRSFPGEGHGGKAQKALTRAVTALATTPMSSGLFSGFTGVAWVVECLVSEAGAPPEDDMNAGVDDALAGYLQVRGKWKAPYDLIEGLVGIGVYALERMPRPSGVRLVELVVKRLAETAEKDRSGVAWRSRPDWVPAEWRAKPFPYWNLGLAHGVPGVIAFLGRAVGAKVGGRDAERLLEKSVAWLLAQELPRAFLGSFDSGIARGASAKLARLAWCYGDPGVAAALLVAARAVGERSWERHALRIALRAAARTEETGVVDAGLCHGAAGLAQIFHRLYRGTGDDRLAAASRHWFARTLEMRKPGKGFGGYLAYRLTGGAVRWDGSASLLEGAGGVALALAGAIDRRPDLSWDRAFLLSDRDPRP